MWPRNEISGHEFKYNFGSSNSPLVPIREPSYLDYLCLDDLGAEEEFQGLFGHHISTTLPPHSPRRSEDLAGFERRLVRRQSEQLPEAECVVADDNILTDNPAGIICTYPAAAEKHKKKPRKPRITCPMIELEDLEKLFSKPRAEAAESLNVSLATLKRVCRKHEIQRWPFNRKRNASTKTVRITCTLAQAEAKTKSLPPKQIETEMVLKQENKHVIVKVRYMDDFIRFEISSVSNLAHLEDEISTRFKLQVGSFDIKYMDDEQDWILIRNDADVRLCINSVGSTIIKMLVLPCSNW